MDYDDIYLMELLKSALYDCNPALPDNDINWQHIYDKAVEQNIIGLIYNSICKIADSIEITEELTENWKNNAMAGFMYSIKQFNEFERMHKILINNGIKFSGLKGCILRSLYPVPEFRSMGDFDVLINKEDLPSVKDIFSENGYNIKNDYVGIVCNKGNITWEIFYSLEQEFKVNTGYWDSQLMENTTEINNINCPDATLFFLHMIIHTAKHCISEGAGIRNLCDIALFLNKYKTKIEFGLVESACKEQGYYKIYCHLINAAGKWFSADTKDIPVIETDSDTFAEYMLLNGIFGKHGNTIIPQLTKTENKDESIIRKLFFPSVDSLRHRYKYLDKYFFLLPVAWIDRFFSAIFRHGYEFSSMLRDTREAIDFTKVRNEWIEKMDIID